VHAGRAGKTKHFQTLNVTARLTLCDCPGLVLPRYAASKAEMVAAGAPPAAPRSRAGRCCGGPACWAPFAHERDRAREPGCTGDMRVCRSQAQLEEC